MNGRQLAILLLITAAPVAAQQVPAADTNGSIIAAPASGPIPAAAARQQPPGSILASLKLSQSIRVRVHDGPRVRGDVYAIRGDSLFLVGGTSMVAGSIDSLWVRRPPILAGAIIGLVVMPAFWSFARFCELSEERDACSNQTRLIVGSAIMGAACGAFIGSRIPGWRLRHASNLTPLVSGPPATRLGVSISF